MKGRWTESLKALRKDIESEVKNVRSNPNSGRNSSDVLALENKLLPTDHSKKSK